MTELPVVYATCPACGCQTGTQKASGAVIRCSVCAQEHGEEVMLTVPERGAAPPPPEPKPLGRRIKGALGLRASSRIPRPVSRNPQVARGIYETACRECGLAVWRARLSPQAQARAGYRSPVLLLEPRRADGESGGVVIGADGLAAFSGKLLVMPREPYTKPEHKGNPVGIVVMFGDWELLGDLEDMACSVGLREHYHVAWVRNRCGGGATFRSAATRS